MLTAGAETKDESAIYVELDTVNEDIWKQEWKAQTVEQSVHMQL